MFVFQGTVGRLLERRRPAAGTAAAGCWNGGGRLLERRRRPAAGTAAKFPARQQ